MKTTLFKHRPKRPGEKRKLSFTLTGQEGKPWRIALMGAAALLLVLLIVALSRVEPNALGSAEVRTIQDRGVLRVGVRDDIPGMGFAQTGLEAELGDILAQRLLPDIPAGNSVKYVTVDSMTIGPKIAQGAIDVAIAMMPQGAQPKFLYSQPYYSDPCYFITSVTTQRLVLQGIRAGCVQNTPSATLLESYVAARPSANITIVKYASYPDMIEAVMESNVEVAVMTQLYIEKYQAETDVNPDTLVPFMPYIFRASAVSPGTVNYCIACPTDTPALITVADLVLDELQQSGQLQSMYTKYGLVQDYAHEEE
ncbi:MAG: transporter substrate-binding domain-containing protein [Clostridia bacterium]|nr:transporter substrate-binding domain-containing protein [Clostridia bacterium]